MKKCQFCGEMVQDEAIKCKHCGSSLKPNPWLGTPGTARYWLNVGCLLIIVFGAASAIVALCV